MIEQFDDTLLEKDIAELTKEVQGHSAAVEAPREAIRGVIGEKLYPQGVKQPSTQKLLLDCHTTHVRAAYGRGY
jgi:hypothetical protein